MSCRPFESYPTESRQATIAPAEVPATFTHSCTPASHSAGAIAPANAIPLTPPPSKTPSARCRSASAIAAFSFLRRALCTCDRALRLAEDHVCEAFAEAGQKRDQGEEVEGAVHVRRLQLDEAALQREVHGRAEHGSDERPERAEHVERLPADLVVDPKAALVLLVAAHTGHHADDGADRAGRV